MEILFLGTSAGWPLPRLNCQCHICQSADPKDKRWRPSVLINGEVLIDTGPDFYHEYRKFQDFSANLKAIFLTHNHPDHYFGLWDVAQLARKKKFNLFLAENNLKNLKRNINDPTISFLLNKAKAFNPGQVIKLNSKLTLIPFLVDHSGNTETCGFAIFPDVPRVVHTRCAQIVYIPDFRNIPQNSLKYLKKARLAIFDGSTFEPAGPARFGHMAMRKTVKLAKKLKIRHVYFTHIGHGPRMDIHKELEKKIQKLGGKNFHLAYDGLKLEI